nr:MAG TPA: hypothetical protein [Caudoviricetes sp.]
MRVGERDLGFRGNWELKSTQHYSWFFGFGF